MWHKAAKDLSAYSEAVVNVLDVEGFPVSVRQVALRFDPEQGTMPLVMPAALRPAEGPASLLAHFHNDQLWALRAMLIRGRVERRGEVWTFVSTEYKPRSPWRQLKDVKRAVEQYLTKRGLSRPKIAYDVIHRLFREAKSIQDP